MTVYYFSKIKSTSVEVLRTKNTDDESCFFMKNGFQCFYTRIYEKILEISKYIM